jgi:NAD(P)-dependent dehydrogenase (short-subunit alcohol dehydrogenase family)
MTNLRPMGSVRYDNQGRVVIVTGGCQGIGAAIVKAFADSGATVVCADVLAGDAGGPVAVAARSEATGSESRTFFRRTDVAREQDCAEVVRWTFVEFGGIDVLVNNAAIQPPSSYLRVDEVPDEDYQKMLAINFSGYFYMAKHVFRVMRQQQQGVVVNIASGQAHRTARQVPIYGPIKAANILQAQQWGIEYARDGIRVVSVSPGAIDTPLVRASLAAQGGADRLANRHPLGRIGKPEEVASAVLWLSSHEASFITATDLPVDGGLKAYGAFAEPYDISTVKRMDQT